jgi:predicted ATPase with chaperone activity
MTKEIRSRRHGAARWSGALRDDPRPRRCRTLDRTRTFRRYSDGRERGDPRKPDAHVICPLDDTALALLANASAKRQFSARALDRITRVTRTIADLAGSAQIAAEHVAEAIHYRRLERLDGRAA